MVKADVGVVVFVEQRQAVVLCVSMCSIRERGEGREVVAPVEARLIVDGVVAAEQEVDVVRLPGTEGFCKLGADKGGRGRGREVGVVAHAVELDICLDVLCELD